MSQIRISQLPQANTVAGDTVVPVVQAGETQQATVDVLRAEIVGNAGNIVVDNITFRANAEVDGDESQILSVANSSGDGNGYTTLQLIPDVSVEGNDQYLIIDPTEPTHIHIRAGGTIDASSAELYLGGEENYVRVIDDTGVRLQNRTRDNTFYNFVDPGEFNTATWFESTGTYFVQYTAVNPEIGDLAFTFGDDDENTVTVTLANEETYTLTYGGSSSNLGGGVYRFAVVEAPPTSPSTVTAMDFEIWTSETNSLTLSNNDFSVEVEDDVRITGNDTFSLRNRSATDPITVRTDYDGADRTWQFGADGTLTTPGDIVVAGDVMGTSGAGTLVLRAQPESNTAVQLNDSVDSTFSTVANLEIRTDISNTAQTWRFGVDGNLSVPDAIIGTGNLTLYNIDTADESQLSLSGSGVLLSSNSTVDIQGGNSVSIRLNPEDSAEPTWQFVADRDLPEIITPAGGASIVNRTLMQTIAEGDTWAAYQVLQENSASLAVDNGTGITLLTVDPNGVAVTAVGCSTPALNVAGNITATRLQNDGNLEIRSAVAGTIKNWTFDTLGDFNMPVGGNISGSGLITADRVSATSNVSGGNLISSTTIYGNVDVVLGDIANVSATKTRIVGDTDFSYIQTGNGTIGTTGNIVFSPYLATTQRVVIDTGTGNVTATGNISGSNILGNGAAMTGVATQVEGSWNVTTGTNNYSFTVPVNGVYQLWVRGNIPGGIITYTATVSVTNNNVPVLGQQFAWNYTDAGSPLLITAIPDQIVGTVNAISNALPAVGTTSNTFVFGINNSSGGNVTVNYGYTKLS
jgi:hypothetical protein